MRIDRGVGSDLERGRNQGVRRTAGTHVLHLLGAWTIHTRGERIEQLLIEIQ